MTEPVSLERLKAARLGAAKTVERFGEEFLWVFETFDEEIKRREKTADTLARALEFAAA